MKTGQTIIAGLIFVMMAAVVFVKAGQRSGESGGSQAASIISSTGYAGSSIINSAMGG